MTWCGQASRFARIAALSALLVACGETTGSGGAGDDGGSGTPPPSTTGGDAGTAGVDGDGDTSGQWAANAGGDATTGGGDWNSGPAQGGTGTGTDGGDTGTDGEWQPESPPAGEGSGATPPDPDLPPDEPPTEPGEEAGECDTENKSVLYLSADDSNSMAGPAVARGLIERGQKVYKGIRTYEFLNYYGFDYPAPEPGELAVNAALADLGDGEYGLQIGVRAHDVTAAQRRPVNLTLSIDTSSSMGWGPGGQTALDRVKQSCHAIANALTDGDVLSIVTWADEDNVLMDSYVVQGSGDPIIKAACDSLAADGRTNFSLGVEKTYNLAVQNLAAERSNRVVLFSDGGANVEPKDIDLIASHAQDAESEGLYLIGVGVGDPWNFNDGLMDELTDAGKGAYIFLDSTQEADEMWGERFVSNVEVAARDVRVELTLPPTFSVKAFYGEEISTDPDEVEPQHLATNDAMIFNQVIASCAPEELDIDAEVKVVVRFSDPITFEEKAAVLKTSIAALSGQDSPLLVKGNAIVAYAEALKELRDMSGDPALALIDETLSTVDAAQQQLQGDADLEEIQDLLATYRSVYDGTYEGGGTAASTDKNEIEVDCGGCQAGATLDDLACGIDVCDPSVLLEQNYSSPTQAPTEGTYAAATHFGSADNDLSPKEGGTYALMATGPAQGTAHSTWLSQQAGTDPYSPEAYQIYDAVEYRLKLRAPEGANGFAISYVFFSEEYDDYVGSSFNDKFYVVIEAGSTNAGEPTVVNYTRCRNPETYFDFICSPGMQYCEPGERYCYVAINTALSECCWLDGCPNGTAETNIAGTGFECAPNSSGDGDHAGSSTGWLTTHWPIEPNEEFELVFHLHDTSDGVFDSATILDSLQFFDQPAAGTVQYGYSL